MRIFLIEPTEAGMKTRREFSTGIERNTRFVVAARSAPNARKLAAARAIDESVETWTDPALSTCKAIGAAWMPQVPEARVLAAENTAW